MRFRLLGPLEAVSDGRTVEVGSGKQQAILAVLLLDANRAVSRDRIVDELWERPPPTALHSVEVFVSRLRRALGDGARLERSGAGYRLVVDHASVDVAAVEEAVRAGGGCRRRRRPRTMRWRSTGTRWERGTGSR